MSSDCYSLGRSSPALTEVTFHPHSPHCCSFTAVVRDGYDGRGVSFSQVARLIKSIGHVGKIDDFSIKPMEQHSFLLTGFSRHNSSRPSFSGAALSTIAEPGRDYVDTTRTRPQEGRAINARALALRSSELSSSDEDGSHLNDSDPNLSSDDEGSSTEDEPHPSTRMNIPWEKLDEQRLLAWKKEGKPWDWIFKKFPGRTQAAIRTRWTMLRPRGE
jgi:hypothetical protein